MNAKLQTNLDTNLLKLIAIVAMVVDHVGGEFFPQYTFCRWIGRMAFPIFCYCLTVGLLYTHDIKKYLMRLGVFALISQPFWILAFHSNDILGNLFNMNIFFTLFISLLTVWGFKEKKWLLFGACLVIIGFFNFDYSFTGVILMLIFYLCRNKPWLGALLYIVYYLPAIGVGFPNPLGFQIGGVQVGFEIFSLLALPLIYLHTHSHLKISKWFFYGFYPAHLLVIYLLQWVL